MLKVDVRGERDHGGCPSRLGAWLDGELDRLDGERVAAHVAVCAACAREVADLQAADASLAELPEPGATADLTLLVLTGVRRERRRERIRMLATAAALVLATGLGVLSGTVATRPPAEAPVSALATTLDSVSQAFGPGPGGGLGPLSRALATAAEEGAP